VPPGAVQDFAGVGTADRVAMGDRDDSGDQADRAVVAQPPSNRGGTGAGTGGTGKYVNHELGLYRRHPSPAAAEIPRGLTQPSEG
jgi:hypothetical protein